MKRASVFLTVLALLGGAAPFFSASSAGAAPLNTQSSPTSDSPPDTELLIFPNDAEGKTQAESKPAPTDQTAEAAPAAPDAQTPHVSAALAPLTPHPPRLVAPPGW